ncbi:MAG: hypothetical protein IPO58_21735 [Betaproteobacteria bacterium]|nr:hypothetical protein [Betaproteobacteria bacterium]
MSVFASDSCRFQQEEEDRMKPLSYKWIAAAVLTGFAVTAQAQSAHTPPSGPPTVCNAGICKIDVTVKDCGASGGITVAPAYLRTPMGSGSAVIHWKIVTPGYVFAQGGIRFDPPNANFQQLPGGPANEIRMRNNKKSTGNFYYFVDVLNCIPVDPFIENF